MTLPRAAAQVLSDHVTLEIRCIDRILLTFRQPRLQYGAGIHGSFCHHRGNLFVSSALMHPMTEMFTAGIHHYIAARGLDLVRFAKGQRKDEVAREYLAGHDGGERLLFAGAADRVDPGRPQPHPGIVASGDLRFRELGEPEDLRRASSRHPYRAHMPVSDLARTQPET